MVDNINDLIARPPVVDWNAMGNPLQSYRRGLEFKQQQDIQSARKATLADLPRMPDGTVNYGDVAGRLAQAGDFQGLGDFARLADAQAMRQYNIKKDERDFGLREREIGRSQSNSDRNFGLQQQQFDLQRRQADAAARGFEYREVDDGQGGKTLVQIEKATGRVSRPPIAGGDQSAEPNNPFATGKMNETEGKAAGFADRMLQSEGVLRSPSDPKNPQSPLMETLGTNAREQVASSVPYGVGNYLVSGNFQRYEQAKRDFINAQLRRESGAVISPQEFENAHKQYFPMPGDDDKTMRQKAANRRAAVESMGREGGRSYRPRMMFNEQGGVVERPQQRSQTGRDPSNNARVVAEARSAIERGANPEAVKARLKEMGIDLSGN